jgi:hypothetical protein
LSSRLIAAFGVALLLAAGVAAAAGARSEARPFLTPISARFDESRKATVYTVQLKNGDGTLVTGATYTWKLDAPADDPMCDEFAASASDPREATWFHSEDDGCAHKGTDHNGTVHVTATSGPYTCTALYQGSATGTGPDPPACLGNEPRSCNEEQTEVKKAKALVEHLEGQIKEATEERRIAQIDVVYARGIITGIESEPPGFWDTVVGADVYLGRLQRAEDALAKAQKALNELNAKILGLRQELLAAKDALAKALKALKACQRSVSGVGAAAGCEAQAQAAAVAKVTVATAKKAQRRLAPPTTRALTAVRAALDLLQKPAPNLPGSMRSKLSSAAARTKHAEAALTRLLTDLARDLGNARRASAAAAARLAACQQR